MALVLERIEYDFTVCKVPSVSDIPTDMEFYFIGRTDEEISLVCKTSDVPAAAINREDGWKAFRITGILDFSLTGILAPIATILADNEIGIFAVSTYNTDYVLVKNENYERALDILSQKGYGIK